MPRERRTTVSTVSLYYMEEGGTHLPFNPEKTARVVIEKALEYEGCPYEAEVSLLVVTRGSCFWGILWFPRIWF